MDCPGSYRIQKGAWLQRQIRLKQDYNLKVNFWYYRYRWNGQHWECAGSCIGGCRMQ